MFGKKKCGDGRTGATEEAAKLSSKALLATGAAIAAVAPQAGHAAEFNVGSQAEFAAALQAMAADRSSSHTINITQSFDMSAPVAPIIADPGATVTINGNGFVIDGSSSFRPFFVYSGTVNIGNLTIADASAHGGDGAGGGMGAGGGVFVNEGATVSIVNVAFVSNSAVGGDGSTWRPQGAVVSDQYLGGGGGLGGDGGESHLGGGGGLYGDGGDSRTVGSGLREDESGGGGGGALGDGGLSGIQYGGGGGGGFNFAGGRGDPQTAPVEDGGADHGGGGGGFDGPGGHATLAAPGAAGAGGGGAGGTGNVSGTTPAATPGQDGGLFGGGGGGAGDNVANANGADARASGGDGGFGGGGGGAGGERYDPRNDGSDGAEWLQDHTLADLNHGGDGGVFGGGGGADAGRGGAGGDFGGGGGSDGLDGGDGGYGGGGGGGAVRHLPTADWPIAGEGGAGGFGGGRGYGYGDRFDTGFGGGAASTVIGDIDPNNGLPTGPNIQAHGGGGAGFGGAVFVRAGGNLIIGEGVSFGGGSVAGGQGGGGDATAGMALGSGIFIQDGDLTFNIGGGMTSITDTIADATGNGADSGALIKSGAGTLVLSGANAYSGGTTIAGGTIRVENNSAFGTGAVTTTGSTIDYANGITIDNSIVLMSNPSLNVDVGLATQSGDISESGGVFGIVKTGEGELVLSGVNTFTGVANIHAGTLTLAGGQALSDVSAVSISSGGLLSLTTSEAIGSLAGAGAVELGANTLTTGGDGTSTSFSGVMAGAGGLVKIGAGTFTLTGANTYTGPTNIDAGALSLAGGAALSDLSAVTVSSSASLLLNDSETIGSLAGAGNVELGANTLATGVDGTSTSFAGVIGGTGGLVKTGMGTFTLTGANSYTGATSVQSGTLAVSGGSALADSSAVTVSAGAMLALHDAETIGSLAGAGAVDLGTSPLFVGADGSTTTFSGVVSGDGALVKIGGGSLTLAGGNTYTGQTTIQGGTLVVAGGSAIGDTTLVSVWEPAAFELAASETIGGLGGDGQVRLGGSTLTVGAGDWTVMFSGVISGSGGLTKIGGGTLTLVGDNTFTGQTVVAGGELALWGGAALSDTSAVTVDSGALMSLRDSDETIGSLAGGGSVDLGGFSLTAGGDGTSTTFAGAIGGTGGLVKIGAGAFTLTGQNTFTGAANVEAGTLALWGGSALSDLTAVNVSLGATLTLNDSDEAIGSLSGDGNVSLGLNWLTAGFNDASTVYSGVASGGGGLIKVGAGELTLTGANAYTGETIVLGGTLTLANEQSLLDTNLVFVDAAAALSLGSDKTLGELWGGGSVLLGANSLTIGAAEDSTFSGAISGEGGLIKEGVGVFVLNGANTFTGATQVLAGTLALNSGHALSDASAVSVATGATLALGTGETIGSLSGAGSVNLGASLLSVGADGSTTTFTGVVFGGGALAKVGGGSFTLAGANTYTGPTFVTEGTLIASGGLAIFDESYVVVDTAGTFGLAADETVGGLEGDGQVILGGNVLTVGGGDANSAFLGAISGSGGLTKIGTGDFELAGANTFSGPTVVSAGQLSLFGGSALSDASAVTVQSGALLSLGASETVGSLGGDGAVDLGAFFLTLGGDGSSTTFSGVISGGATGGLGKTGEGVLTLSGTNAYTGATVVQEGSLILAGGAAIADVGIVAVDANGALYLADSETIGDLAGDGAVDLGANTLSIAGGASIDFAGAISGTGGLAILAGGEVGLSGANTYSGGTTNDGLLVLGSSGAAGTGAIVNHGALLFSSDLANDLSGGGVVQKFGAGFAELTGANTHTDGTMVAAGTLRAGLGSLGTGQLSLLAGSRFELDQSTDATLGIAVLGDAASVFAQMGGATITYNDGQFGDIEIVDGVANVVGTIAATGPNGMSIFSGSALTGDGVIIGDVANAGLVSPGGDSIAVLTIDGDYTHEATGVLRIQFDPSRSIDLLNVTGTATIEGGVVELVSVGGADGTGLTFLAAAGGVSGEFDAVTTPSGGATGILYTDDSAQITATAAEVRPSTSNSQLALIEQATIELLDAVANELEQGDGPAVWGDAMFGEVSREETGASLGYEYRTNGVAGGFRTKRLNGFSFGGAIAQSKGEADLDQNAGGTESEGLMGAAHGDWSNGRLTIAGGVTVGTHDFETRRRVLLNGALVDLTGETDSDSIGFYLGASALFELDGWTVTAAGRLNQLTTTINSYEEEGSNILRLRFGDSEADTLVARGRLSAERRFRARENMAVTPSFSLGVINQTAGGERSVDATFVSTGLPISLDLDSTDRTFGEGRAGVAFEFGERFEIGAHAAYVSGGGQDGMFGSASARFRF